MSGQHVGPVVHPGQGKVQPTTVCDGTMFAIVILTEVYLAVVWMSSGRHLSRLLSSRALMLNEGENGPREPFLHRTLSLKMGLDSYLT